MSLLYPINIDIKEKLCVVIGGGLVAKRKVEALLVCKPRIVVISPMICEDLRKMVSDRMVTWQERKYKEGDLAGASLVFAASNDRKIQSMVVAEANRANIPVNDISDPGACTFQVPATCRRGDLLFTVATGGGSPALAARIRKEIEGVYGEEYGLLLSLLSSLRNQVVDLTDEPAIRKLVFEKLMGNGILDCIRQKNWTELMVNLEGILPSGIDVRQHVARLQKRIDN